MTNIYSSLTLEQGKPKLFRKVFPSYDWVEDVWRVNQIMNLPKIIGREDMGFVKNVPNEEVKSSDAAIKTWIDTHLEGCSCLVVFVGARTYQRKWVLYEIQRAISKKMAYLLISLEGMKNHEGVPSPGGPDPFAANGLYVPMGTPNAYIVRNYNWIADDGLNNIGYWIDEACIRAER